MTAVRSATGGRVLFVVLLLGVLLVGFWLLARPTGSETPLDPRSTAPAGTRALVLLLEEQGAEVQLSDELPDAGEVDVALVLQDRFDDQERGELVQFVEGGGRLVVADPSSPLTPPVLGLTDVIEGGATERGTCTIEALEPLERIDAPFASTYEVRDGSGVSSCFGSGDEAFVVAERFGQGTLVALGGAVVLTNEQLDQADDAPLAATLLAPEPGTTVRFVAPPALFGDDAGGGEDAGLLTGAGDVLDPSVQRALWQLAAAFLFFAAWRAVRLGKPVEERQPVQVEGSELVSAVGRLLQQNRNPQAAANLLRHDLRRTLEERLGVPSHAPPEVAVEMVAARTGLATEDLGRALLPTEVKDDADLVEVGRSIEAIRAEVLHGQHP